MAVICVAQFVVVLDVTIVTTALPTIRQALGFSDGDLQWVFTAYALVFGGLLILGGRRGRLGRQAANLRDRPRPVCGRLRRLRLGLVARDTRGRPARPRRGCRLALAGRVGIVDDAHRTWRGAPARGWLVDRSRGWRGR